MAALVLSLKEIATVFKIGMRHIRPQTMSKRLINISAAETFLFSFTLISFSLENPVACKFVGQFIGYGQQDKTYHRFK